MRDDDLLELYMRDRYADRFCSRLMFALILIVLMGAVASMVVG